MRQSLENRSAALVRSMATSAGYAVAGYDFAFLSSMVQFFEELDDSFVLMSHCAGDMIVPPNWLREMATAMWVSIRPKVE